MKIGPISRIRLIGLIGLAVFALGAKTAEASVLQKQANNLGLVAYYPMNEGTSTIAGDSSGRGNTGTLNGQWSLPQWVQGKVGRALHFTSSHNSYVAVPTISIPTDITISAWVYSSDYTDSGGTIASKEPNNTQWNLFYYYGWIYLRGGGTNNSVRAIPPSPNAWHHIVGVITGTTGNIYIDGVLATSGPTTVDAISNGSGVVNIGRASAADAVYWDKGSLDEVRIYNRALGATEVLALYNNSRGTKINSSANTRGPQNGLVGMWSFDGADMTATTAYDRSGSGNNGTLTGGPAKISGKIGQALKFGPTSGQYVNVASPAVLDNIPDLTYSAWINIKGVSSDSRGRIVVKDIGGCDDDCVLLQFNGGYAYGNRAIQAYVGFNTTDAQAVSQNIDSTHGLAANFNGGWLHVAMTYSDTTKVIKLYLDGVEATYQVQTTGVGTRNDDSAGNLLIGNSGYGNRGLNGSIDDVRIYNRVLSATEITRLYNMGSAAVNKSNTTSLTNGLVLYHTFDGNKLNTTTSTDSSGLGNNGTLTGANGKPRPISGKIGQAMRFDGVDDVVQLNIRASTTLDAVLPITMSAWAKLDSVGTAGVNRAIVSFIDQDTNTNRLYTLGTNSSNWYLTTIDGSSSPTISVAGANTIGVWNHLAVVITGTSGSTLYVNGVSAGTTATSSIDLPSPDLVTIGARILSNKNLTQHFFPGSIDDVRIYNRALSAGEVLQLYNQGK